MIFGFDIVLVPQLIAGLGILMVAGVVILVIKDNWRQIGKYFFSILTRTFAFVPWRYSVKVAHLGVRLYSRIFRFVRSWEFWWASVTGSDNKIFVPIADSVLRLNDTNSSGFYMQYPRTGSRSCR
jgi:hypothetical protein